MINRASLGLGSIAFAVTGGACGGGKGADSFARYWSDGSAWCGYLASCGAANQAQCLASWPSVDQTEAALSEANIPRDDIMRCETAARLLDQCTYSLSCDEFQVPGACMASHDSFQTNCSLVIAAIEVYFTQHPVTPARGAFQGTYEGSESGTFTGNIFPNGGVSADIDSPSAGALAAAGTVSSTGALTMSAQGGGGGGALTVTFSGNVQASGASGGPDGTGSWQSSAGLSGTWRLEPPPGM